MPINVTGTTDTSNAMSAQPAANKVVVVVGVGGTTPSADINTIFNVIGTSDAASKWGADADAVSMVDMLIKNGATNIKGIRVGAATPPATPAEYDAALDVLLSDSSIRIIVLDTSDATIQAEAVNHLALAEAEDMYRYFVPAIPADLTLATIATLAGTFDNKRVILPGLYTVDDGNNVSDGILIASAVAGVLSCETKDPALPLNSVQLKGFGGVKEVYKKAEYDALVVAGVTPIAKDVDGTPYIYRCVTTYTTDAIWTEQTTVMIADEVLKTNIDSIKSKYKRTKNVVRILDAYRTTIIANLQRFNDLEIIENFDKKTVIVRKSTTDPYGAEIEYTFDVVTPLYNVTITQSMII